MKKSGSGKPGIRWWYSFRLSQTRFNSKKFCHRHPASSAFICPGRHSAVAQTSPNSRSRILSLLGGDRWWVFPQVLVNCQLQLWVTVSRQVKAPHHAKVHRKLNSQASNPVTREEAGLEAVAPPHRWAGLSWSARSARTTARISLLDRYLPREDLTPYPVAWRDVSSSPHTALDLWSLGPMALYTPGESSSHC